MNEKLGTTKNSRIIQASPEKIYEAITDPETLMVWLAPEKMTAKVHNFDLREDGGYLISLFYPESERNFQGKTSEKEDRYSARFIELKPAEKVVQAITFDTNDPDFMGEMILEITLKAIENATEVIFLHKNIPVGIRPEDNDAGTRSSLAKLAQYVNGKK